MSHSLSQPQIPSQLRPRPRFLVTLCLVTRSIWIHRALRAGIPIQILHAIHIVFFRLFRLILVFILRILLFCLILIYRLRFRLLLRLIPISIPILRIIGPPRNAIAILRALDPLRAARGILDRFLRVVCPVLRGRGSLPRTVGFLSPPLAGLELRVRVQLLLEARTEGVEFELGDRAEDVGRRDGAFQRCLVRTDPLVHY